MKSLKIIKNSISKKNNSIFTTSLILIIIFTLLFFSNSILRINQDRVYVSRTTLFGKFNFIGYKTSEQIKSIEDKDRTYIDILNKDDYKIGAFFNDAENLVFIKNDFLKKLNKNEAFITKSIATKLNLSKDSELNIFSNKFVIKDIINDFGFNWIRGEKEERSNLLAPNIIISRENFFEIAKNKVNYRIELFDENIKIDEVKKNYDGNIYENKAIKDNSDLFLYKYPFKFEIAQVIIIFILVQFILNGYILNSRYRYKIYNYLGMKNSELKLLKLIEIILISVFSLLISLGLSFLFSIIYINSMIKTELNFNIFDMIDDSKKYIVSYMVSVFILLIFIACNLKIKKKKKNIKLFKKIEIKSKKTLINYIGIILVILYMSNSLIYSLKEIEYRNTEFELHGQIKKNYDYQINFIRENIPYGFYKKGNELQKLNISNENDKIKSSFYYYDYNNQLYNVFEKLSKNKSIKKVDVFHENYYTYLTIPREVGESDFINILFDKPLFTDIDFWKQFNIDNQKVLVKAHLVSMPDNILESIYKDISNGNSIKSLLDGDSAILVSPSYNITKIEDQGEFGKRYYWDIAEKGENILRDENLKNYSSLDLYFPKANETIAGMLNQETFESLDLNIQKVNIPLAAKTYKNIGWLDVSNYSMVAYRILVSEKFLIRNNLNSEPTRLHVFLKDINKSDEVLNQIYNLTGEIKDLQVRNLVNYLEEYHNFQKLKIIVGVLFFVMITSTLMFSLIGTLSTYWEENRKDFILYKDLGMTKKMLLNLNIKKFLLYILVGLGLQILLYYIVYKNLGHSFKLINIWIRVFVQIMPFIISIIFAYIYYKKKINAIFYE